MNMKFYDKIIFLNKWYSCSYEPTFQKIYRNYIDSGLLTETDIKIINNMYDITVKKIEDNPSIYLSK